MHWTQDDEFKLKFMSLLCDQFREGACFDDQLYQAITNGEKKKECGRKEFYYRKQRQRAISKQVSMIFGQYQNHQN